MRVLLISANTEQINTPVLPIENVAVLALDHDRKMKRKNPGGIKKRKNICKSY